MDYINTRSVTLTGARTTTSKDSVIVLSDSTLTEIAGYPKRQNTTYVPYGDFKQLTAEMALTFGDLAAVVICPHLYESTLHMGDIRRIKQLSSAEGAVMIWDDIQTTMDTQKYRDAFKPDYFLKSEELLGVNAYETEFVQMEIFTNQTYLKHGLKITNESFVLDIGANIGLFTLFAKQLAPQAQVFAFEPAREVFKILSQNTQNLSSGLKLFNMGMSDKTGDQLFTYYPGYSVISGFHTDIKADEAVIQAGEKFKTNPVAEEVIKKRFAKQESYLCKVISLHDFIQQENLKRVDFLKIDAEKAELKILESLSDDDWAKISQIVVEVHGEENFQHLARTLEGHGFKVEGELGIKTSQESIYTIYGKR